MKPNPIIGTCPCPVKGCALPMNVKRMASRASIGSARKGGTLYGDCPDHGRFGFDGAQKMQDYITENSTKCPSEQSAASAPGAPGEQSQPASSQQPKPALPAALNPQKTALPSAQPPVVPPVVASTPKAKKTGLLDW